MGLSMAERKAVTKVLDEVRPREQGGEGSHPRPTLRPHGLDTATCSAGDRAVGRAPAAPRSRAVTYGDDVGVALRKVWIVLGGPCGKRLAPFMGEIVEALERHGELTLEPEVRAKLMTVSPATRPLHRACPRGRVLCATPNREHGMLGGLASYATCAGSTTRLDYVKFLWLS